MGCDRVIIDSQSDARYALRDRWDTMYPSVCSDRTLIRRIPFVIGQMTYFTTNFKSDFGRFMLLVSHLYFYQLAGDGVACQIKPLTINLKETV